MGSSSKPSGSTTTVQSSEPWAEQKPYLQNIFSGADYLYNNYNPQYYPLATYAGPTANQTQALNNTTYTAQNDLLPATSKIMATDLMSGAYLSRNPALSNLTDFSSTNLGTNAPGQPTLGYLRDYNQAAVNPAYNSLAGAINGVTAGLATTDAADNLRNLMANSGYGGSGVLSGIAYNVPDFLNNTNLTQNHFARIGVDNPGTSTLSQVAGGSLPMNADTNLLLNHFGRVGTDNETSSSALSNIAGGNLPMNADTNLLLNHFGRVGTENPGADTLSRLSNADLWSDPSNLLLNHFGKIGADAPGSSALGSYSSGERLAAGNPYLDAVSKSVLSRALPGIQSQFINSGTLSSPEAMRASAEGAASAIAPYAFDQFQKEEANQIAAANSLNDQSLQARGLQQQAAGQLSDALLQGGQLQAQTAGKLGDQALQNRQLQQQAAGQLSDAVLQGGQLQAQAAGQLGSQNLQNRQLQQQAAGQLSDAILQGGQLQTQAAGQLGQQALQGRELQQNAAQDLSNSLLQGQAQRADAARNLGTLDLQARAQQSGDAGQLLDLYKAGEDLRLKSAQTLGDQFLQGAALQGQSATTLGSQALAGRELQQRAADTISQDYRYGLDNMLRGLALAPNVQDMQYTPWTNMYNAEATQQNLNQAAIDDAIARWNYTQQLPYDKLNYYQGAVTGNYGNTSTRTDPYFTNRTSNALSGALGGASLGSSLFGPYGGLFGGGLGLISSLF